MALQQITGRTFLRRTKLEDRLGRSRSSIYKDIEQGLWVRPVTLGARAVGWPSDEVDELIAARVAGYTEAEIRALVTALHARRTEGRPQTASTVRTPPARLASAANEAAR